MLSREEDHGGQGEALNIAEGWRTDEMVERIRSLLARFSENEESVRRLVATDIRFDALCSEYRELIARLESLELEVNRLKERKAGLEEDLLMHIEGYEPQ
jgi:predicted  nucleic acid-binding Zn-ribbon protein